MRCELLIASSPQTGAVRFRSCLYAGPPGDAAGFRHIPTRRKPACPGESIPSGSSRYADTGFFLPNRWMRIVEPFQQAIQLQGHGDMFFYFDNNYHISNNSSPR